MASPKCLMSMLPFFILQQYKVTLCCLILKVKLQPPKKPAFDTGHYMNKYTWKYECWSVKQELTELPLPAGGSLDTSRLESCFQLVSSLEDVWTYDGGFVKKSILYFRILGALEISPYPPGSCTWCWQVFLWRMMYHTQLFLTSHHITSLMSSDD